MDIHHDTTWWVAIFILGFGFIVVVPLIFLFFWVPNWARARWHTRGTLLGRFYCAVCRYDVRGITRPTCPECGAGLDGRGLLYAGRRPPVHKWVNALLVVVLGLTPLTALLWAIGVLIPSNYYYDSSGGIEIRLENPAQGPLDFSFHHGGRFDFAGDLVPDDAMTVDVYDWSNPNTTLPNSHAPILGPPPLKWQDPKAVHQLWDQVVDLYPSLSQRADYQALKAGFENYIADLGSLAKNNQVDIEVVSYRHVSSTAHHLPLINLWFAVPACILLSVAGLALLYIGLACGRAANAAYETELAVRTHTFLEQLARNSKASEAVGKLTPGISDTDDASH